MTIRYIGPHDAVEVVGVTVTRGDVINLGDVEPGLLKQPDNWQSVTPAKKTAAKKTATEKKAQSGDA